MNHCVPDFETEDDYLLPASSNLKRHKKTTMGDEDIMELLWQNGQVVMQNQNQRGVTNRKVDTTSSRLLDETTSCNLFMQEDEMVSWLHYPNDDNNLDLYLHNNDIFPITTAGDLSSQPQLQPPLPPPPPPSITLPSPSPRPPIAPVKRSENFLHFSRAKNMPESAPASLHTVQSAAVESNDRPLQANMNMCNYAGTSSAGREPETYDIRASSSPVTGGSGASASVEPSSKQKQPPVKTEDRKRKGRDVDDTECYSEDVEFEYHDGKKKSRGSTSTKRTRAAEVHNLSERRRRDRINEKMKALQELIPRCNKSDKASMLDEAIEYLKSLQMQVQMMSMGYGMVPMMFPGVQRYMPTMAAAMGMGMGMDQVGMNRPMVPYHPPILPGPAAAPHLPPRFPIPRFQMAQVPIIGPTRNQTANPSDPTMNPFPIQSANQPRMVPFADPYQQYHGLPQTQFPQPQNHPGIPAITSKPSSSKDVKNPEHQSTG